MRFRLLFSILALVPTAFAGCVGSEAGAAPADDGLPLNAGPARFDENAGAIEGLVLDGESQPVAGADVAILGAPPITTVSAQDGRFVLNNVPPGQHALVVQKLGYEASTRSVDVVAGEVTEVTLSLVMIDVLEVYHATILFKGYFDCTWSNPTGSGPCGYLGATNGTTGNPLQPLWVNSKRKWNYMADANTMTVLNELTWKKGTAATGEKMAVIFSHGPIEGKERDGTHNFCRASGYNPVRLHWERESVDDKGDCPSGGSKVGTGPDTIDENGMLLQSFVSSGNGQVPGTTTDLPAGVAYQQSFDLYASLFYGEVAPEFWTAFNDG